LRSTVATANRSFLDNEKERIAASVSEVSISDVKIQYFLDFKSSSAAPARPPVFEDRVLPRRWSSRSTMSRVATRTGPLMRSRSSSSMSLLCSSIAIRKLVSSRTVRGWRVLTESFRTRSGANSPQSFGLGRLLIPGQHRWVSSAERLLCLLLLTRPVQR
jgi:hypothetical protein